MNEQKKTTKSDKLLNLIMCVVVAVILVIGVYATYGKLSTNIKDKAVKEGRAPATVDYLARQADLDIPDYLAQYGLELNDTIKPDTAESDMMDNMTLENYLKYNGGEQTADEVLEGTKLTDKATKDTLWKDFLPMAPAASIVGDEATFNQLKEQYGFDNDDITWGELEELMKSKQEEQQGDAAQATEAPQAE